MAEITGDPYRIRTDVNGVRGRCLNHLTNGPHRRVKLRLLRFRVKLPLSAKTSYRFVAPPLPREPAFAGLRSEFWAQTRVYQKTPTLVSDTCLVHLQSERRKSCRRQVFPFRVPAQETEPQGDGRLEVSRTVHLYQKRALPRTVSVWYTFRDSNPGHPD